MSHKPFYLHQVNIKFRTIDHINHQYVKSGGDGLKVIVYFGGVKSESKQIKYLQGAEEIDLNFAINVQSLSASVIEIWLQTYHTQKFLGAGQVKVSDIADGEQYLNFSVDSTVMASVVFTAKPSIEKVDISREIIIEEDEVILKKDDSAFLKQQAQEKEKEVLQKREIEESEALKRAQAKKPMVTVTSRGRNNETFL